MNEDFRTAARESVRSAFSEDGAPTEDEIVRLYLHAYYLGAALALEQVARTLADQLAPEYRRLADAELDDDDTASGFTSGSTG